jgi:hypothetical protein
MTMTILPQLDEVEAYPTRGEVAEVQGEDYDLPLAKAIEALNYWPELHNKAWLDDGLEEVLVAFDESDNIEITEAHKDLLRSRDLQAMKAAMAMEAEVAGVPEGFIICWALVRI